MPAIAMPRLSVVHITPRITRVIRSRLRDITSKWIWHALRMAALQLVWLMPTASQATVTFTDNFDGNTFQSAYWTKPSIYGGGLTVSGGVANFSCTSMIDTSGKYHFSGNPIVVEARMVGSGTWRDTTLYLIDANNPANGVQAGDTNYTGDGLYTSGSGAFNTVVQAGNGNSVSTYKEYRLTLSGTTFTIARGDTLANITETRTVTIPTSIVGKTFFLRIGGAGSPYCPAAYDWIRVMSDTVQTAGPTGLLNDTGQTTCYNGSAMVACSAANTGDASAHPRQDGRFGRDVAAPAKIGGGAAGFDFTKVCMNGSLNCTGAANTGASPAATDWACTKDNVTNLTWSLQTQGTVTWNAASTATYPNAGHNSISRCGFATGWRLPTKRELHSIVHNGLATPPMIDANYFPSTQSGYYWTSDIFRPLPTTAWVVYFNLGYDGADAKTNSDYVRLVRSGL